MISKLIFLVYLKKIVLTAAMNRYRECPTSIKQIVTMTMIQGMRKTR